MKKKEKASHNSIVKTDVPKKISSWGEDYFCMQRWSRQQISEEVVERWAAELEAFPDSDPDARRITQFYRKRHIHKDDFYRLCNKYPALKMARESAERELAEREYQNVKEHGWNWAAVKYSLEDRLPEAKIWAEREAERKMVEKIASAKIDSLFVRPTHERTEELDKFLEEKAKKCE